MRIFPYILHCSIGVVFLAGCGTQEIEKNRSKRIDECRESEFCTIEGIVSVHLIDHVKMGRLTVEDGECIGVSFSKKELRLIEEDSPTARVITGRVMPGFPDATLEKLAINGRRVGLSQCQDFYIFVK